MTEAPEEQKERVTQNSQAAMGRGMRGYMAIAHSILSISLNGTLKTHIMFRCNLNSRQLDFYLRSLEGKGLLEKGYVPPSAKVEYRTTPKGRAFMETYYALVQLLTDNPMEEELFA